MLKYLIILFFVSIAFGQQSWKVPIEKFGNTYLVTICTVEKPYTSIHIKHVYAVIDTTIRDKEYYRIVRNLKDFYVDKTKYYFQRWVVEGETVYW